MTAALQHVGRLHVDVLGVIAVHPLSHSWLTCTKAMLSSLFFSLLYCVLWEDSLPFLALIIINKFSFPDFFYNTWLDYQSTLNKITLHETAMTSRNHHRFKSLYLTTFTWCRACRYLSSTLSTPGHEHCLERTPLVSPCQSADSFTSLAESQRSLTRYEHQPRTH